MSDAYSKILVIDDNPQNLDILSELLDQEGFVVLFALDGVSGLQRAEEGQPHLILLDIMMPGWDGFETCQQLKAKETTKDIPVIFMTALSDMTNKIKGFSLGAVDYITKPIHPKETLARITTHLKIQRLQHDLFAKNEELRAANAQLHEALERERELNKLKSRFISIASHEIRSPLASIQITVDLLKRYSERITEEKKLSYLERIEGEIQRMAEMLNDILLMSKVETETFEFRRVLTDVTQVCRELVEKFSALSEETHTFVFFCALARIEAWVDPKLFRPILSNLLSNAIKYSPRGGTITCELAWQDDNLVLGVKDKGIGIPEDDLPHLFDAFYRGKNVGKIEGTGLGLSIVNQFVELHGGHIRVISDVNTGTTFTILFPSCQRE